LQNKNDHISKKQNWFKLLFKTSSLIAISKVIGFLRDLIISFYFGTSLIADAFNYANLLTGNLFILLGGLNGPFHSATSSTLCHIDLRHAVLNSNKTEIAKEQNSFLTQVLIWVSLSFIGLSTILFFSKTFFLNLILSSKPELISTTAKFIDWMLPMFALSGIIVILFGASSYKGNYFWPSLSPLISSSVLILGIFFSYQLLGASILGIASSLGALLQALVQLFDLKKVGFSFCFPGTQQTLTAKSEHKTFQKFLFQQTESFRQELKNSGASSNMHFFNAMLFPALLSSTIGSLNVYVDSFFCASLQEGSWTAILIGNKLIQLPFGVLVGASLVSFLPRISCAALMLALSRPIIQILFQRGEFNESSTHLVDLVLLGLSASLITGLPREIYTRAFYGIGDSRTPMLISLVSIAWNALLDWYLGAKFQAGGIAMSTTLTALINSLFLALFLKHKIPNLKIINWTVLLRYFPAGAISYFSTKWIYSSISKIKTFSFLSQLLNFVDLKICLFLIIASTVGLLVYVLIAKGEFLWNRFQSRFVKMA
jgi:putative peptidoglycan lipid II flippase